MVAFRSRHTESGCYKQLMMPPDRTLPHHRDKIIHNCAYLIRVYRLLHDTMAASKRDNFRTSVPNIKPSLCCHLQVLVGHVRSDRLLLQGIVIKY